MHISSLETTVSQQRVRIEELEEELRQAREVLSPSHILPREWGLEPAETKIILSLAYSSTGCRTHAQLAHVIGDPNRTSDNLTTCRVRVCTSRKKLAPFDIAIWTRWGVGYEMPLASREIVRASSRHEKAGEVVG